jgi:AcrR family transcriptional regulator
MEVEAAMARDSGTISLRERKKLATRRALEETALRLFAEKGFDQVTVEEIAEAVGVSSRTFFRYFGSKEDLLLGPMLEVRHVLEAALAERPADEPVLEALRRALARLAHHLAELGPELARRSTIVRATPVLAARAVQVWEEWRELLIRAAASRLAADPAIDLRPHVAAAWAMAGLSVARELWERGAPGRDLPSLLEDALEMLSGNLADALAWKPDRPLPDALDLDAEAGSPARRESQGSSTRRRLPPEDSA